MVPNECLTCKKQMDTGKVEDIDCGGDCLECMGTAGDPAASRAFLEEIKKLRVERRDFFAGCAIQGLLACPVQPQSGPEMYSRDAFKIADAMIKERDE